MRRIVPVVHATFAPPLAWQQVNHDPDRPCKRSDCATNRAGRARDIRAAFGMATG
nr:MAG TPA: hypothetical protein [Caudoviricetes sp.]